MKAFTIKVDDNGYILDKNGTSTLVMMPTGYEFELAPTGKIAGEHQVTDIAQLVTLGVTPDDLLKLKASGII